MRRKLIALATQIAKSDFAIDYDDSVELTLADAITILIMENVGDEEDIESDELYDFIYTYGYITNNMPQKIIEKEFGQLKLKL